MPQKAIIFLLQGRRNEDKKKEKIGIKRMEKYLMDYYTV